MANLVAHTNEVSADRFGDLRELSRRPDGTDRLESATMPVLATPAAVAAGVGVSAGAFAAGFAVGYAVS